MVVPAYPMGLPDTHDPYRSRYIRKHLANGIDCGVKSPFNLTMKVPKESLSKPFETKLYVLQNLPGNPRVGLKYFPNEKGTARIAIRVFDQYHERMGVKAWVKYPRISPVVDQLWIEEYKRKDALFMAIIKPKECFSFALDLMDSKSFLYEYKEDDGIEFLVEGYVYVWDKSLMDRENWKFGPGVTGFYDKYGPHDWDLNIQQEFVARDGSIVLSNAIIVEQNCEQIAKNVGDSIDPLQIRLPLHRDVIEIAIKLMYDHNLVEKTTLEQKLELLIFFNRFVCTNYKEQLEEQLLKYIDYANVGNIARYSKAGHSEVLQQACLDFIRRCIRNKKFFLGYQYDQTRKMIVEAAKMELMHEWVGPNFERN